MYRVLNSLLTGNQFVFLFIWSEYLLIIIIKKEAKANLYGFGKYGCFFVGIESKFGYSGLHTLHGSKFLSVTASKVEVS